MRDEWTRVALGDVIEQVRRPVNVELDRTYVELGTRMHFGGLFEKEPITGEALGKKRVFWLQEGDLVLNIIFAVGGAIAVAGPEANGRIASHRFPTFRPRDNLCDVRFLRLFFETAEGKQLLLVNSPGSAGANRTLSTRALLRSPIPAPPIDEQRRIVDLISSLDATISATRQAVAKAEQARRGILVMLLQGPDAAGAAMASRVQEVPWTATTLGEISTRIGMGPFGSNIKVETFVDDGVPIISGSHLHGARLLDSSFRFITEEHAARLSGSIVGRGDVVLTHAGTVGQAALIPQTSLYSSYVLSQRQFFIRCDLDVVDPAFLVLFLRDGDGRWQLLSNINRTGVPSLSQPVRFAKQMRILLPPLSEQRRIVEVASWFDDEIDSLQRLVTTGQTARLALLSDLLSGTHEIPMSYDRLLEAA
jgi:restriction endonuclease S subunit